MAHDHEEIVYGMNEVKELFDASVLTGTIVSVDTDNDKAHVNISGFGQINDVPIFYHCPGSIVVEGGSVAFSEGDSVYVLNKEGKVSPGASDLQIVGFVDGLRPCVWEPWNGPEITSNHPWDIKEDEAHENVELVAGGLEIYAEGHPTIPDKPGIASVLWDKNFLPPNPKPVGLKLKIKVKVDITGPTCTEFKAHVWIGLKDSASNNKTFVLGVCSGFDPATAPHLVFVGDNGGEEQTIDLTEYGLIVPPVSYVYFAAYAMPGWTAQGICRHINFC